MVRLGYVVALLGPCVHLYLHLPTASFLEQHSHLILFVMPIVIAAYLGGFRAGLLATGVTAGLTAWAPNWALQGFDITSAHDRILWIVLLANGILISVLSGLLHHHRQQAEQVNTMQRQLAYIAGSIPGALYAFRRSADGTPSFLYVNQSFAEMLGFKSAREMQDGVAALKRIHPDDAPSFNESILQSEKDLSYWHRTFRVIHPNQPLAWFEAFAMPARQPDGSTIWTGFLHDITKQKLAESQVEDLSQRWRFAIERSGIGIWDWSAQSNKMDFSPTWKAMLGYTNDEIGSEVAEWKSRIHPDDVERLAQLESNEWNSISSEFNVEYRLRHKNGSYIWVLSRRMAVAWGEDGKPTRFVGTHTDITAIKESAEALQDSEARLRAYIENSPVALFILSPDGRYLDCNLAAVKLLGYTREKVREMKVGEFSVHPERAGAALARLNQVGSFRGAHDLVRQDGRVLRVDTHATKLPDGNFIVFHIDISAEYEATRALRLQSAALEAAANSIVITDPRGIITWVNSSFCKTTGYRREECIGKNSRDLVKSGMQEPGFYKTLWTTISNNQVWRGQLTNRKKNGEQVAEEMTITPVRDEHGVLTNFIAIKQDITERLAMEQQLLRTQRLESVGRLASGIAHDLNNILTPVLMAPPLLRSAVKDPETQALVDSIEASVTRGAAIIRQLLLFGRGKDGPREPVSMRALVREMAKIAEETFPKNIRIKTELPNDMSLVMGDSTQLHQVLLNLAVNARDAMPNGGEILFRVTIADLAAQKAGATPGATPGPHVRVDVQDTGHGVDPRHLDKLFDPYFTTKKQGKGTGLGLSTSMGIVRAHGGFITANPLPDRGTTFSVWLPVTSADQTPRAPESSSEMPRGHGEHILVVDDEPEVRNVLCRILSQSGYHCACCATGPAAIELLAQPGPPVRVLLTDILMPEMDGRALARTVHTRYPDILIVTMTGYDANQDTADNGQELGILAALQKPLSARELLTTLHRILHPAPSGSAGK